MAKKKASKLKSGTVTSDAVDKEIKKDTVTSDAKDEKKVDDAVKKESGTESKDVKEESDVVNAEAKSDTSDEKTIEKTPEKKSLKEKLSIKKVKEERQIEADENKDGYVSAREMVNSIDKDVKVTEKSEDEILANHVAEQLEENEDYFIFRVRKSNFLVITGIVIFLLWMIPLIPYLKSVLSKDNSQDNVPVVQVETPTPTPTPLVEELDIQRIRIKIDSENEKSASMSSLLKSNGFTFIDVLEIELEESGVSVVVKKGDDDLRSKLLEILKDEYDAGSSSSQLTEDSDFSAAILIGK